MKKILIYTIVITTSLTLHSCAQTSNDVSSSHTENQTVSDLILKKLSKWNLNAVVSDYKISNQMNIEINFKNIKKDSSINFYADLNSNTHLINTVIFEIKERLIDCEIISVLCTFDSFSDQLKFAFTKTDLKKLEKLYEANQLSDLFDSGFSVLDYDQVTLINAIIKKVILSYEDTKVFDYKELKLWDLLINNSKFCFNKSKEYSRERGLLMIVAFASSTEYKEFLDIASIKLLKDFSENCSEEHNKLNFHTTNFELMVEEKYLR